MIRPERDLRRVASWPHWYALNPYLELFYRALEPSGIEHVRHVPLTCRGIRTTQPPLDVLHLHWPEPYWREPARLPLLLPLWRVARLARVLGCVRRSGVLLVWTVHNLEPHEGFGPADRVGYQLLHRSADLRLFTSAWARDEALTRWGGDPARTQVIPIGNFDGAVPAPRARESVLRELGIPASRRVLLCAGDVRPYKGFDVAVEAMAHLPRNEFHLVIAGRPREPAASVVRQSAHDRSDVTFLLAEQPAQLLSDLMGAADAVVLPYRRVTGSGALVHALTMGRGVVVSDLPYFREVVGGQPEARAFAPPGDAAALAAAITGYTAIPAARRQAAARAVAVRLAWPALVEPFAAWLGESGTRLP